MAREARTRAKLKVDSTAELLPSAIRAHPSGLAVHLFKVKFVDLQLAGSQARRLSASQDKQQKDNNKSQKEAETTNEMKREIG